MLPLIIGGAAALMLLRKAKRNPRLGGKKAAAARRRLARRLSKTGKASQRLTFSTPRSGWLAPGHKRFAKAMHLAARVGLSAKRVQRHAIERGIMRGDRRNPEPEMISKKLPKGAVVRLAHGPNSDIARGYWGDAPSGPREQLVPVTSWAEASALCRAYIAKHGLGNGNWYGGEILVKGKQIAHVSYNGRVWTGTMRTWQTNKEIKTNPKRGLSAALRKRLMEWRSPDYPAIKALAMSKHPATEAYDALRHLKQQYERIDLRKGDLAHLAKTIRMVEAETGVRANPKRRGRISPSAAGARLAIKRWRGNPKKGGYSSADEALAAMRSAKTKRARNIIAAWISTHYPSRAWETYKRNPSVPVGYQSRAGRRLGQDISRGVQPLEALAIAKIVARQGGDHVALEVIDFWVKQIHEHAKNLGQAENLAMHAAAQLGYEPRRKACRRCR